MSQTQPAGLQAAAITAPDVRRDVRGAIARAAQATGIDFDYLLAQAKLESSLNPSARAGTSSAAGLYQFTGSTWLSTLERHGADHGLAFAPGALRDPVLRSQMMALRFDPETASQMAAELAGDNKAALTPALGREPDPAELYLAHFLGADGAKRFLTALSADPGQSAAALMPAAAAANTGIFHDASGAPRSVGAVMDLLRGRLNGAMENAGDGSEWAMQPVRSGMVHAASGGPLAHEFQAAQAMVPPPLRASMADTLRSAFAIADGDAPSAAPSFVRAAYGRLKVLGL